VRRRDEARRVEGRRDFSFPLHSLAKKISAKKLFRTV
jgi:hypothetical protein